ncbi:unnamed protein product [Phytophthora fragariaefolia]|uniref:Unnamed protein product n=1 Tax=Phytophthora fragariaefolia TaxID=1490495 RepID=A0A9W6WTY1_9STRA|nr:unnamed protein product [Phytophthora fragariaefolia]
MRVDARRSYTTLHPSLKDWKMAEPSQRNSRCACVSSGCWQSISMDVVFGLPPDARTEVRLHGPYVETDTSESDTGTPNPDLIIGDEDSGPDTPALRAPKPGEDRVADANNAASEPALVEEDPAPSLKDTSDARKAEDVLNAISSHVPSASASAPTPAEVPQRQPLPPDGGPDPMGYEESGSDQDREQGEVPDPNTSPQLTEQQRITHLDSLKTAKTAAAVACGGSSSARVSRRHGAHQHAGEADHHKCRRRRGGSTGTTEARQPKTTP